VVTKRLVPNPLYNEAIERREQQRELRDGWRMLPTPQFVWAYDESSESAGLLSEEEVARGQTKLESLLDGEDGRRYRRQGTAARYLTVEFYKLPEESWQTVLKKVVVPVLERRGLRRKK
jgi:hypothetical protein